MDMKDVIVTVLTSIDTVPSSFTAFELYLRSKYCNTFTSLPLPHHLTTSYIIHTILYNLQQYCTTNIVIIMGPS